MDTLKPRSELTYRTISWGNMWRHPSVWRMAARFLLSRIALRVRRQHKDRTSEWTYPTIAWRQVK